MWLLEIMRYRNNLDEVCQTTTQTFLSNWILSHPWNLIGAN